MNHTIQKSNRAVTLNAIPIDRYRIAITSNAERKVADAFAKRLSRLTAKEPIPIVSKDEMPTSATAIIRIGAAYPEGNGSERLKGYILNVFEDHTRTAICIDASGEAAYLAAFDDLFQKTEIQEDKDRLTLLIAQQTVYSMIFDKHHGQSHEYTRWILESTLQKQISDGVIYTEQLFYDDTHRPYRTYVLTVDPAMNTFDMGSGDDGFAYILDDPALRQTTEEHMRAAVKNGKNPIAGINADFFFNRLPNGDYRPWGLTVKEGRVISLGELQLRPKVNKTENVRPFFAINKDNKALIAMESEYSEALQLETAVGAAYIFAKDGVTKVFPQEYKIIHGKVNPRSVVGFRPDGKVVMLAIDGRQPTHSNGACMLQATIMMHRFGASDAVLLDCGGSVDIVLRDPQTDQYITVNSPSDGHLRRMYNSLLVVKK